PLRVRRSSAGPSPAAARYAKAQGGGSSSLTPQGRKANAFRTNEELPPRAFLPTVWPGASPACAARTCPAPGRRDGTLGALPHLNYLPAFLQADDRGQVRFRPDLTGRSRLPGRISPRRAGESRPAGRAAVERTHSRHSHLVPRPNHWHLIRTVAVSGVPHT